MSQEYFEENLAITLAEFDRRKAEYDLMLEMTIDELRRKAIEWDIQVVNSKRYNEQSALKAAEFRQSQAVPLGFQMPLTDSQYIEDQIARMNAPKAAEFGQIQAAQVRLQNNQVEKQHIIDDYIAKMSSSLAAEPSTLVQDDYSDGYKPRCR